MAMSYHIEREIAVIGQTNKGSKRLTFTSWNGQEGKYDLRLWKEGEYGEQIPSRGVTLSVEEAVALKKALEKEV